jgi:hypothetical protein
LGSGRLTTCDQPAEIASTTVTLTRPSTILAFGKLTVDSIAPTDGVDVTVELQAGLFSGTTVIANQGPQEVLLDPNVVEATQDQTTALASGPLIDFQHSTVAVVAPGTYTLGLLVSGDSSDNCQSRVDITYRRALLSYQAIAAP